MKLFILILSSLTIISCSGSKGSESQNSSQLGKIKIIHTDEESLTQFLNKGDLNYLFLTTSWCGGGKLTLQNIVLPNLKVLQQKNIDYFIVFMEEEDVKICSYIGDFSDSLTVYKIDQPFFKNAFFDRVKINNIVSDIDPAYDRGVFSAIPVSIIVQNDSIISDGYKEIL